MNENRKDIILTEIEYWKKNRLLPEKYCGFLLALYSEGDHHVEVDKNHSLLKNLLKTIFPILFLLLNVVVLLANYFTEMFIDLQITINFIFLFITVGFSRYYCQKSFFYYRIFMIFAFLLFFIGSIEVVDYFFSGNRILLAGLMIVHCLIWFLSGEKLRLNYLKVAGIAGLLIIVSFLIKDIIFQ
jgi:hypothetical protein